MSRNLANGSMGLLNLVVMWIPVLFLSYVPSEDSSFYENFETPNREQKTVSVSERFSRICSTFHRRVSVSHISIHYEYCLCHNNTTCCFDRLFIME